MDEILTESDEADAMVELDLVARDNVRLMVLEGGLAELDDPCPTGAVVVPFPRSEAVAFEFLGTLARLVLTLAEHRAYPPDGVIAAMGAVHARTPASVLDLANLIDETASHYMDRRNIELASACWYAAAKVRLMAGRY